MRMIARFLVIVGGVGACAALVWLLRTDDPTASTLPAPPEEPATPAPPASVGDGRGFVAVLIAGESVDVAARTAGLVTEMKVRLGDLVATGSVIAALDDRALRDDLAAARAGLEAARAARDQSALELAEALERRERWEKLAGDGGARIVSSEELAGLRYKAKYARQQLVSADARLTETKARVEGLQHRIEESVIRAPFTGRVTHRYLDAGAMVGMGNPIARLVREGDLRVRFAVPEEDIGTIRHGKTLSVAVESLETPLRGSVDKVSPEIDPAARVIIGEAVVTVPSTLREVPLAGRVARVLVEP
jgi:RND family efflux transporter MFP subunit